MTQVWWLAGRKWRMIRRIACHLRSCSFALLRGPNKSAAGTSSLPGTRGWPRRSTIGTNRRNLRYLRSRLVGVPPSTLLWDNGKSPTSATSAPNLITPMAINTRRHRRVWSHRQSDLNGDFRVLYLDASGGMNKSTRSE